ncbi:hypothetical protein HMI01_00780 [Halolactibacillus miurensis]|uniref:Diguanylate cyclase (GGDEF) domain-containing protein n=1 Tax=Halolactibacillus miurensis TaxID=306541 RepID=A0A1I6P6E7_9BACI|nr:MULTISPECIES: GGDEF domain-containing protein [Halolactibacillus]GEM03090.1 hypothetical protein HMI01_00780 [Halolactibacillus miurensis]SFS35752.1 diguanylate cyclase (GGDEF) domain-containing protein [Halolactibacillus miurensis]
MNINYYLIIIIVLIVIISQLSINRNKYKRLALTDATTGLPNKRALSKLMNKKNGEHYVIYYIDLDTFKKINDSYGHDCGDYVLKQVADRLSLIVKQDENVYRVGGDEFIYPAKRHNEKIQETLSFAILDSIKQSIDYQDVSINVTATIGISESSVLNKSVMIEADQALLLAKRYRKGSAMHY